jgi:hypothetical protein
MLMAPLTNAPASPSYQNPQYSKYKAKYGKPGSGNSSAAGDWNPIWASPAQSRWLKRGLVFAAAFLAASFSYMFLAHLPFLASTSISRALSTQWFIAVLFSMVPLATFGALLVDWDSTSSKRDTMNRFYTGMSVSLGALGSGELLWHMLLRINVPQLQLCAMLLLTAVGATIGTNSRVSELVVEKGIWAMKHLRPLVITAALLIGGILGFTLTSGAAFGCFTPFGVLLGMGITMALVLRVGADVLDVVGT